MKILEMEMKIQTLTKNRKYSPNLYILYLEDQDGDL